MKPFTYFTLVLALLTCTYASAQNKVPTAAERVLTVEPGVGIHTNFGTDFLITNLVQWNPTKRFSLAAHTSFNVNNIFQRDFNYVKTNYNYSINQKFGAGTTFYSIKSAHTLLAMVGARYTAFKETLDNPNFDNVSVSINALSIDYGLMYSYKRGWKKYFFTSRFYLPLSPWLTKGAKVENIQGTLRDVALELGMGIKIK